MKFVTSHGLAYFERISDRKPCFAFSGQEAAYAVRPLSECMQTALEAGGAVTIEELLTALRTPPELHMEPWRRMAAHLERVGGAVPDCLI